MRIDKPYSIVQSGTSRIIVVDGEYAEPSTLFETIGYGDHPNSRKLAIITQINDSTMRYRFYQLTQNLEIESGVAACGNATAAACLHAVKERLLTSKSVQLSVLEEQLGNDYVVNLKTSPDREEVSVEVHFSMVAHPFTKNRTYFPTGNPIDTIDGIEVTIVAAPNFYVFAHLPPAQHRDLNRLATPLWEGTRNLLKEHIAPGSENIPASIPKIALVGKLDQAEQCEGVMFSELGQIHRSFASTGAAALGLLLTIPESLPAKVLGMHSQINIVAGKKNINVANLSNRFRVATSAILRACGHIQTIKG